MSLQFGDIFYAEVAYTGNPSKSSNRPVLVIDELEDNLLLLISTTTKGIRKPPNYHNQFKIPINNLKKAGFTKPSWCRGKILNKKSCIGKIIPEDLNFIIEEIKNLNA